MKKGYKKVSSFCTQSVQLKNVNIYCTKRPSSIFSLGDRNKTRQQDKTNINLTKEEILKRWHCETFI